MTPVNVGRRGARRPFFLAANARLPSQHDQEKRKETGKEEEKKRESEIYIYMYKTVNLRVGG